MKYLASWVFLFLLYFGAGREAASQWLEISAMTYNIRYENPGDTVYNPHDRKNSIAAQIIFYYPDIIGLQEVTGSQLAYLDSALSGYTFVGVARDEGQTTGE